MPTVYRVLTDDAFQSLEPANMDAYLRARKSSWRYDGVPVADSWQPLEMYVRRPTLKKPDIWGVANTLAFEPEAAAVLQLCLDQSAEQLKLPFEGRELIVINITYVLECLNKVASEYDPDLPHMIDEYVFHQDRLDYSLFKIPETRMSEILTVEGLASSEDEFKPLIEKNNLNGIHFRKLFSWD